VRPPIRLSPFGSLQLCSTSPPRPAHREGEDAQARSQTALGQARGRRSRPRCSSIVHRRSSDRQNHRMRHLKYGHVPPPGHADRQVRALTTFDAQVQIGRAGRRPRDLSDLSRHELPSTGGSSALCRVCVAPPSGRGRHSVRLRSGGRSRAGIYCSGRTIWSTGGPGINVPGERIPVW
jgi:hypothetical protein